MASASSSAPVAAHGVAPLRAGQGSSFFWRRLHSLSGIVPVGAFLFEHILISNSTAISGPEAYARQVSFLANLPLVFFLELFGIWLDGIPPQVCALTVTPGLAVFCKIILVVSISRTNCGRADVLVMTSSNALSVVNRFFRGSSVPTNNRNSSSTRSRFLMATASSFIIGLKERRGAS